MPPARFGCRCWGAAPLSWLFSHLRGVSLVGLGFPSDEPLRMGAGCV